MYDVVVVGGGHAGLEAAAAAVRVGARTALVTFDAAAIGRLSCNPAIGGVGKGHLVREIDALGGVMGRLADRCGIQFRLLNTSRGPAVRGPRAQVDRALYPVEAAAEAARAGFEIIEAEVADLLVEERSDGRLACCGVRLGSGEPVTARRTVLSSGTFLGAVLHVGAEQEDGGRRGEAAASRLAASLAARGVPLRRFKTGTPPRLLADSIDFDACERQDGDERPVFFCRETRSPTQRQVPCHGVYTNPAAHAVIRGALAQSPLADGRITGSGPRYCPSFEEKVVRFADRDRHLLMLEPEGLGHPEVYLGGASTSLPASAQRAFLAEIPALRRAEITQLGYAVEYDHVPPVEVDQALELQRLPRLHLAGQVLGTTGYEEAAALGLLAGACAGLLATGRPPLVLGRHEAYAGVLVDDLVTRGLDEPYRMFTSRSEHRLLLGIDSADLRLAARGASVGLVPPEAERAASRRRARLSLAREALEATPAGGGSTLADVCRRPETDLAGLLRRLPRDVAERLGDEANEREETVVQAANDLRYAAYRARQERAAARFERARHRRIPSDMVFEGHPGLSREVQERLTAGRPSTLDQAARLPGVTPAALQVLEALVARHEAAGDGRRSS